MIDLERQKIVIKLTCISTRNKILKAIKIPIKKLYLLTKNPKATKEAD